MERKLRKFLNTIWDNGYSIHPAIHSTILNRLDRSELLYQHPRNRNHIFRVLDENGKEA